ncbi:acyltransferase family protein [Ideonella margarita]|uniref:Heparan-alpha-glucosaminide N-acetyltransferase domain-containing protein n=1 Tax=Ideonella margarita TaxID=2984191 RepID=A0ABU9C9F5_9BURK
MTPSLPTSPRPPRLASVDAVRGIAVAAMILVNSPGDWGHVWWPLEHAEWHGCTPTDLIFPLFLFIVGVSLAMATGPLRDTHASARAPLRPWLARAARLVVLGLVLHLVAHLALGTAHFRPMGVLQRIGLCFGVAAVCLLRWPLTSPARWLAPLLAVLAVWGTLLLTGGTLAPLHNLAARVDVAVLGPLVWQYDAATGLGHEPEGLLSTLGALGTCWLGVMAGELLRRGHASGAASRQLAVMTAVLLIAGALTKALWPWNKALWTPSFVLWTGGCATAVLLLAHRLIDLRGAPAVGRAFGINAITAYAGSWLLTCLLDGTGWGPAAYARLAAALPGHWPLELPSHAWALAQVLVWWLVVRYMQRRGWIISV